MSFAKPTDSDHTCSICDEQSKTLTKLSRALENAQLSIACATCHQISALPGPLRHTPHVPNYCMNCNSTSICVMLSWDAFDVSQLIADLFNT